MDIYGLAIVYDSKRLHKVIPASFRPFLNKKNANAKLKKKRKK
jgi:hypothetical protein